MTPAMRHSRGTIIERSNILYVRYYTDDSENGSRKATARLCAVDKEHWFERRKRKLIVSDAVKQLRDQVMLEVNRKRGQHTNHDMTVQEFWDQVYVPSWADRQLRSSTRRGYEKTWSTYVQAHLGKRRLAEYATKDATNFLTQLVRRGKRGDGLSQTTHAHVKALMSAVFAHAVSLGLIEHNPIKGAKLLTKARAPRPTEHYTLAEAKAIIEALSARVDAQCAFACAFFLGLRPSEIAGLRWEDVLADRLHVQRAAVLGIVDGTKTRKSTEQLLLIEPVRSLLEAWRAQCGNVDEGWVFPNQKRGPLSVASFTRHVMQPLIEAAGCKWRALYAGRRGAGTILRDLTGNLLAAQQVLRHEQLATTDKHYALPSIEIGDAGLKMLEAAWLNGKTTR